MTLKGFINFLLKIKLIISYMYLNIINDPANIEASIEILRDSKYCITNRVNASDDKIEIDIESKKSKITMNKIEDKVKIFAKY